jgi:FixJ family two-component response regulator
VIADTGPGIPEAARQRMFVEGYRLSRGGGAELGYGLGLAIVRELSLAIGAAISVETGKRHGTVFRVDLASIPVAVGRENADRLADVDFSGRHILIVDDDRLTCEALQRRLSDCDALVEAFHDINEIRTLLASGTVEADLFILDYHLAPDLTARNLLDAWTGIGYEQVIVITGHADLMLVRDMELKGLRVLKKPVDPADLVRVCQVVLQQPEETGPPHAGMEQQTRSPLPTRRSAGDSESVSAAKDPPHDA